MPLKRLEETIESYSSGGKPEALLESHEDYGIREYVDLKAFIKKAFLSLNEKLNVQSEIAMVAAGVAHDMASPLAVMAIILDKHNAEIPKAAKSELKESMQSIRNTAYTLLEKYRNPPNRSKLIGLNVGQDAKKNKNKSPVFLPKLLESVILQKRLEWAENPCEIALSLDHGKNTGWVFTEPGILQRVISNLLNNAYEALEDKRKIDVRIDPQADFMLGLSIIDSGCGIAAEHILKVLEGKSFKHSGKGLGLLTAKTYMEEMSGKLILSSNVGQGTQVKLLFPMNS